MTIFTSTLIATVLTFGLGGSVYAHNNDTPRGISRAPGIEKRMENGKGLPKGIEKRLERRDDKKAPELSNIMVVNQAETSAEVLWLTNERADSKVWIAKTADVSTRGTPYAGNREFSYFHRLHLKDLSAGTTYFFVVSSADKFGNVAYSPPKSFATKPAPAPAPDITAPEILSLHLNSITSSGAELKWSTNEKAKGRVLVSASSPIVEAQSKVFVAAELQTHQSMKITGLQPNTAYYYLVEAIDAAGNVKASATLSFRTALVDATAPVISGPFVVQIDDEHARVIWATDERADSKVWVSATSPVGTAGAATKLSAELAFFHDLRVGDLDEGRTYYYIVSSTDASGNVSYSAQGSFTTEDEDDEEDED